jgi:hypothetical protein
MALKYTEYIVVPSRTQARRPEGNGKTQLALSVAAANTHVERLQCFRGISKDKATGRFDEGLQRLYMERARTRELEISAGKPPPSCCIRRLKISVMKSK